MTGKIKNIIIKISKNKSITEVLFVFALVFIRFIAYGF